VPSISLAVIEISATSYSIKLSRIYRKSVYFWYLVSLYVAIILISIFGLLYGRNTPTTLNTLNAMLAILGVFFIMPYFLAITRLLDPKKAFEKLGQQVKAERLVSIVTRKPTSIVPPADDPIYPMLEIAIQAINRKDLEILRLVLDEIYRRYGKVLIVLEKQRPTKESTYGEVISEVMTTGRIREIIEHFLNHLRTLEKLFFEQKYEQTIVCLVEYFGSFSKETMKYKFIEAWSGDNMPSFSWIYEIKNIGVACAMRNYSDGVACSLRALSNLSDDAIRQGYHGLQNEIASFVKDFSVETMKTCIEFHFVPTVALQSMSMVVEGTMKYGNYDSNLVHQIEDMNELLALVIKTSPDSLWGSIWPSHNEML